MATPGAEVEVIQPVVAADAASAGIRHVAANDEAAEHQLHVDVHPLATIGQIDIPPDRGAAVACACDRPRLDRVC